MQSHIQPESRTRTDRRTVAGDSDEQPQPANSPQTKFLDDVDPETPVDQLGERWREYRRRHGLDTDQTDLAGWHDV